MFRNRKGLGATALTSADIAGKAIGFLITPYLANRMGPSGFGVLNLYLAVTQILTFTISLGGAGLLAAEYIRNGYTAARRLRSANLRLSFWLTVGLLVLSLAISSISPTAVPVISGILVVAVSYIQALNVLELSYYRGSQYYTSVVVGQLMFAGLNVTLTVLAFEFYSPTVDNRLLSIALAGAAVQTAYAIELRRKHYERADRVARRSDTALIVRFGMSIFVHQASQWIRVSVDRFVLSAYLGLAVTGIYSVGATLAIVESTFFAAVSQQLQPFLYQRLKDGNFAGFRRMQRLYLLSVLVFTLGFYSVLVVSFDRLFDAEYYAAKLLLPALLAGAAAQSLYYAFTHAAIYERRGGQVSLVTGGALIVHVTGLGVLALFDAITASHIAVVFLSSSLVAMLGMAFLSRRLLMQLRRNMALRS